MKKIFSKFTLPAFSVLMTVIVAMIITLMPTDANAKKEAVIKKIRGEGISFQLNDEREVRATAIDDALKKAVISAYDSLITQVDASADIEILKASILLNPLKYILDYRVLSEGWIRHLVIEEGLPVPPNNALTTFGSSQINSDTGMPGEAEFYNDEEDADLFAPQEQGLKLYHVWIEASIDFKELKSDLSLTPSYEGENTSLVTILLIAINEYKTFASLKEAIEELNNVKGVTVDSFLKGKIVLTAEVWGNPHELLEKLKANKALRDLDIIPSGMDRITIKSIVNR